jgi:hypothetical protein
LYLNLALTDLVTRRSEANIVHNDSLQLSAGARQALPTGAIRLVRIERNNNAGAGGKAVVRRVSHTLQSALTQLWHETTQSLNIEEYMYNPRLPTEYYVYPPSNGSTLISIDYAAVPTALQTLTALSGNASTWGAQTIPVADVYAEPLGHFILHRAYLKEAEHALDPARSKMHFELYLDQIGARAAGDRESGED